MKTLLTLLAIFIATFVTSCAPCGRGYGGYGYQSPPPVAMRGHHQIPQPQRMMMPPQHQQYMPQQFQSFPQPMGRRLQPSSIYHVPGEPYARGAYSAGFNPVTGGYEF